MRVTVGVEPKQVYSRSQGTTNLILQNLSGAEVYLETEQSNSSNDSGIQIAVGGIIQLLSWNADLWISSPIDGTELRMLRTPTTTAGYTPPVRTPAFGIRS